MNDWSDTRRRAFDSPETDDIAHDYKIESSASDYVLLRHPEAGLLHHSDRGTEFPCERYQAALRELGVEVSMSRTGTGWDNAAMEAFFATLAKECVNRVKYQTPQEARSSIFEYIECFYNPIRLHSTLR